MPSNQEIANSIIMGVEVAGSAAQIAAPIVSISNPALGAALALFAPLAEKLIVSEIGMIIQFKPMTIEEQKTALKASRF